MADQGLSIPLSKNMEVVLIMPEVGEIRLNETSLRPEDEDIWRHTDTDSFRECSVNDCMSFVHTTWKRKGANEVRHTFYSYFIGDTVTDSALAYRVASGWQRLIGNRLDSGVIGFKLHGANPETVLLAESFRMLRSVLHDPQSKSFQAGDGTPGNTTKDALAARQ